MLHAAIKDERRRKIGPERPTLDIGEVLIEQLADIKIGKAPFPHLQSVGILIKGKKAVLVEKRLDGGKNLVDLRVAEKAEGNRGDGDVHSLPASAMQLLTG